MFIRHEHSSLVLERSASIAGQQVLEEAWSAARAAEAAGTSRRTAYKWLSRSSWRDQPGLSIATRGRIGLQLEKADIVLELRRTKRMTATKIAAVLHLTRSTVAGCSTRGLNLAPTSGPSQTT